MTFRSEVTDAVSSDEKDSPDIQEILKLKSLGVLSVGSLSFEIWLFDRRKKLERHF